MCTSKPDACGRSEGCTGRNHVLRLAKRSLSPPDVNRRSVRCRAVLSFSGRHIDAPCLRERSPRLRAAARHVNQKVVTKHEHVCASVPLIGVPALGKSDSCHVD
ncbi:hypothetical protein QQF64_002128 [Cirrhinus molitorella]|uniref:Uncharacterized protein n=1 Tax=Cirrhinus molitorella TaxID=172907 RepID=A0ABR3MPA7_9TELE